MAEKLLTRDRVASPADNVRGEGLRRANDGGDARAQNYFAGVPKKRDWTGTAGNVGHWRRQNL